MKPITMKEKENRRVKLMNEALSEGGITLFFAADQNLVNELCEIIGAFHRRLSSHTNPSHGFTDQEIEEMIRESV